MSIVITLLAPDQGILMYGDKRATGEDGTFSDEFEKVFSITETIAAGITGDGIWCMSVISKLKSNASIVPSKLISIIKDITVDNPTSTVSLAGIYDDGRPFLFTYGTEDKKGTLYQGEVKFSLSACEKAKKKCNTFFKAELAIKPDVHKVFEDTIRLGSELSNTISANCSHIFIPFELKPITKTT